MTTSCGWIVISELLFDIYIRGINAGYYKK